jgi:hypothetical protein
VILNRSSRCRDQYGGWWEVDISIDLKTKWRIVEYALKSQSQKSENPSCIVLLAARGATPATQGTINLRFAGFATALCARHREGCAKRNVRLARFILCRFYGKTCFTWYLTWICFTSSSTSKYDESTSSNDFNFYESYKNPKLLSNVSNSSNLF